MWAHTHTGARMPNIFEIQYISVIIYSSSSPPPPLPSPPLRTVGPYNDQLRKQCLCSRTQVCVLHLPAAKVQSGQWQQNAVCSANTHSHALQHTFLSLLPRFAPTNLCWYFRSPSILLLPFFPSPSLCRSIA